MSSFSLTFINLISQKLSLFYPVLYVNSSFPSGSVSKESACNARGLGSISRSGRSLGEGNGNPLLNSCLGNPMDRGSWQATVHRDTKSQTQLSA